VPLVRPGDVDLDAVALLGPIGADRDQLEAIASGLQGADNRRAHANHVPWPQVVDFAVEQYPARASDNEIDLLLFSVVVADLRTKTGGVAEIADPEMLGVKMLAAEPSFHSRRPFADRVLDLLEIDNREVAHGLTISMRLPRRLP